MAADNSRREHDTNGTGTNGDTTHTPHHDGFQSLEVTVVLADLRGYTAVGTAHDDRTLIEILDCFLGTMSDVVLAHGGTVDKFLGDAIMAVFGAPEPCPDHVRRGLACAAAMQLAMDGINTANSARLLPELHCGVGVNTGMVMAGWVGSARHREYAVVGDTVNLASRIESLSLRGQVLMGEQTRIAAGAFATTGEPVEAFLKGQPRTVKICELKGIPELGLVVNRRDLRRSHRVRVRMPFTFQVLDGKRVDPTVRQGTVRDIGYQGMLAELDAHLPDFTDIKLALDLAPLGHRAADVYGKVLHTKQRGSRSLSGIEFTSINPESDLSIRQFVQMLLQGCPGDGSD